MTSFGIIKSVQSRGTEGGYEHPIKGTQAASQQISSVPFAPKGIGDKVWNEVQSGAHKPFLSTQEKPTRMAKLLQHAPLALEVTHGAAQLLSGSVLSGSVQTKEGHTHHFGALMLRAFRRDQQNLGGEALSLLNPHLSLDGPVLSIEEKNTGLLPQTPSGWATLATGTAITVAIGSLRSAKVVRREITKLKQKLKRLKKYNDNTQDSIIRTKKSMEENRDSSREFIDKVAGKLLSLSMTDMFQSFSIKRMSSEIKALKNELKAIDNNTNPTETKKVKKSPRKK